MKKVISILLIIIVLILSIIGYSKFFKENPIKFGLPRFDFGKIGSPKIPSPGNPGKEKTGTFITCDYNTSGSLREIITFEFVNNRIQRIGQAKMIYTVENEYKKYSKDSLEAELVLYPCNDNSVAKCGNVNVNWNGYVATLTFDFDTASAYHVREGLTKQEVISKLGDRYNASCKDNNKATIYGTTIDPIGTYYNKYIKNKIYE